MLWKKITLVNGCEQNMTYIILIIYLTILTIYGIIRVYKIENQLKENDKMIIMINRFQDSIKNKFE